MKDGLGELPQLRKQAQELAAGRRERTSTVHLLAAMAGLAGPAQSLLHERRCHGELLERGGRTFSEDGTTMVTDVISSARDIAKRMESEPKAIHLLLAVLGARQSAGYKALLQYGVDTTRLRTSALQIALGVVAPRRMHALSPAEPTPGKVQPKFSGSPGVTIPIAPLLPKTPIAAPKRPAIRVEPSKMRRVATKGTSVVWVKAKREAPESALDLDSTKAPTLSAAGRNLTRLIHEAKLPVPVGRDAEVEHVLDVFAKREQRSALLVGRAGVGKTSIGALVAKSLGAEAPPRLLIELSASELLAGTAARGSLAERVGTIRAEAKALAGKAILFFDNLHELILGGGDEAMAELKVGLARGELQILAATTPEDHKRMADTDPAMLRLMTAIEVDEPDEAEAFCMLRESAVHLAEHHGVEYSDESIAASIGWSMRYLPGRALPDKAVSVLDLAGARVRRRCASHDVASVGLEPVAQVVSESAEIPVERLLETDRDRMLRLEVLLGDRVVGHGEHLTKIASAIRRNAAGLRGRKPIGTFLLLGPTGVGKTETAKAIAEALFHSADAMTRVDLSEYGEAHSVARLIGAPPGYVGFEAGGQLTEAVKRRPYQVLLLDEIEKAHMDVLQTFLQLFDEGRLTDGRGRRVDFTNTVIILTSNLGAREMQRMQSQRSVGFSSAAAPASEKLDSVMHKAAKSTLPPELYNRLDEVLVFRALERAEVEEIARRALDSLARALEGRGMGLTYTEEAVARILDLGGFDPEYGARPLRRTLARLVESPLADAILKGDLATGTSAHLDVDDDGGVRVVAHQT